MNISYVVPILFIIAVSGCVQSSQISSTEPSQLYDNFCKSLASCEQNSIQIQAADTGDMYSLGVIGLDDGGCKLRIGLEKSGSEKTKSLEGLYSTCSRSEDYSYAENLTGENCRDFVNNFMLTLAVDVGKKESLCTGSLKEVVSQ